MPIRAWAVDIVNRYSKVTLDEESKSLLIYNANFVSKKWDDNKMWDNDEVWDEGMSGKPRFIESTPEK